MHSDFAGGNSLPPASTPILGNSESIQEVRRLAALAAENEADVLIVGEAGTGRTHIARAIHEQSGRSGPFLRIEGTAPASLLDSELLGPKPPRATLFLRDVDALSMPLQERLGLALDAGGTANGRSKSPRFTARLICASSRDLEELVQRRAFDGRLQQRLSASVIHVPPLNSRREDIPILLEHFLRVLREENDHQVERFSPAAEEVLVRRSWNANVRELYEYVRTTVGLCSAKVIEPMDLWLPRTSDEPGAETWDLGYRVLRKRVLLQFEADFVTRVLKASSGNVSMAARLAKIDRKHLWRLIQRTGIRLERFSKAPSVDRTK